MVLRREAERAAARDRRADAGQPDSRRGPDLTALGTGAIVVTEIFVIIAEATALSGPAIVISFLLAGVTCVFCARLRGTASMLPVSGSTYTYTTMGETLAWIIGRDPLLESIFCARCPSRSPCRQAN